MTGIASFHESRTRLNSPLAILTDGVRPAIFFAGFVLPRHPSLTRTH